MLQIPYYFWDVFRFILFRSVQCSWIIIHWDNTNSVTGTNPYSFSPLIYIFLERLSNPIIKPDFREIQFLFSSGSWTRMKWSWMFTVFATWISKAARYQLFPYTNGWCRVKFWRTSWHKMLRNSVTTANCCYETDVPLQECLPVHVCTVAAPWCMCMHCSQSALLRAAPCPVPAVLESKTFSTSPPEPLEAPLARDPWQCQERLPSLHKAHRAGLDSPDKLPVRRTRFCSKSWLVPRADLRWPSEQLISWQKMELPVWEETETANFDRADPFSSLKGLLLLWKPEPNPKTAQNEMGAERTCPSVLKG